MGDLCLLARFHADRRIARVANNRAAAITASGIELLQDVAARHHKAEHRRILIGHDRDRAAGAESVDFGRGINKHALAGRMRAAVDQDRLAGPQVGARFDRGALRIHAVGADERSAGRHDLEPRRPVRPLVRFACQVALAIERLPNGGARRDVAAQFQVAARDNPDHASSAVRTQPSGVQTASRGDDQRTTVVIRPGRADFYGHIARRLQRAVDHQLFTRDDVDRRSVPCPGDALRTDRAAGHDRASDIDILGAANHHASASLRNRGASSLAEIHAGATVVGTADRRAIHLHAAVHLDSAGRRNLALDVRERVGLQPQFRIRAGHGDIAVHDQIAAGGDIELAIGAENRHGAGDQHGVDRLARQILVRVGARQIVEVLGVVRNRRARFHGRAAAGDNQTADQKFVRRIKRHVRVWGKDGVRRWIGREIDGDARANVAAWMERQ